jgi:competence protein ComEC
MKRMPTFSTGTAARSPMIWIAAAFALGIVAAKYLAPDERFLLGACAGFTSAAFLWRRSFAATFLILAAFVSLGGFCFISATRAPSSDRLKAIYESGEFISGEPVRIEGVLARPPEPMPEGVLLRMRAERLLGRDVERRTAGSVRIFAAVRSDEARRYVDRLELSTGTRIRVTGRLERDERFRNPGVVSNIELLDQQGFDAAASLKSALLIERLEDGKGAPVSDRIYGLREALISEVLTAFSPSTAGVLNASLLGNKHFLDRRTAEVFRQGGTFHVLVISGLHITFIGGLILLAAARFTRSRWLQFFAVSAVLWAYAAAVGGEVPVARASLMFTVLLLGRALYRQNTLLNSLGTGALVLLAWRPEDLFSASFQLTFTSVAAIVVMAFPLIEKARAVGTWMPSAETPAPPNVGTRLRRFCEMLYWNPALWERETSQQIWSARLFKSPYLEALASRGLNRPLRYIFEGLVVSAAVQLWMLPLVVIYFHRVTPGAIVLNIWVGALLALESFAAAAALIARQLNAPLAAPLVWLTETFNWLLISVPRLLMEIVGSTSSRLPGRRRVDLLCVSGSGCISGISLLSVGSLQREAFAKQVLAGSRTCRDRAGSGDRVPSIERSTARRAADGGVPGCRPRRCRAGYVP